MQSILPTRPIQHRDTHIGALQAVLEPQPLLPGTLVEGLAGRLHPVGADGSPAARALVFDQFEELFSLHSGALARSAAVSGSPQQTSGRAISHSSIARRCPVRR